MREQEMSAEEKKLYRALAAGKLREELAFSESDAEGHEMKRFWVSWWSGYYEDEGCTKPPFQVWISGSRDRAGNDRDEVSLCAVVDAESETRVWEAVARHFPDYWHRFCERVAGDWTPPGDRFPGYLGQTSISADASTSPIERGE